MLLMNICNKTEAVIFWYKLCILRTFSLFQNDSELHGVADHAESSPQPGTELPTAHRGIQQGTLERVPYSTGRILKFGLFLNHIAYRLCTAFRRVVFLKALYGVKTRCFLSGSVRRSDALFSYRLCTALRRVVFLQALYGVQTRCFLTDSVRR